MSTVPPAVPGPGQRENCFHPSQRRALHLGGQVDPPEAAGGGVNQGDQRREQRERHVGGTSWRSGVVVLSRGESPRDVRGVPRRRDLRVSLDAGLADRVCRGAVGTGKEWARRQDEHVSIRHWCDNDAMATLCICMHVMNIVFFIARPLDPSRARIDAGIPSVRLGS